MSHIVSSIQVITSDIKAYSSFLVDVFDLEVKVDDTGFFYAEFSNIKIFILEMRGYKTFHFLTPFLTIEIDSEIEMNNYYDKYQFYLYRKSTSVSEMSMQKASSPICDPDGRIWSFKISSDKTLFSKTENSKSTII